MDKIYKPSDLNLLYKERDSEYSFKYYETPDGYGKITYVNDTRPGVSELYTLLSYDKEDCPYVIENNNTMFWYLREV